MNTVQEKQSRGRSRKRPATEPQEKKRKPGRRAGIIAAVSIVIILAALAGTYVYMGRQYQTVFFPNTVINGLDASGKSIVQVKEMIQTGMSGYTLTLETREGISEQIAWEEIDLHAEYDGTLEKLLSGQNPLRWGFHYREGVSHTISTMIACDQELLKQALHGMDCMDAAKTQAPVDAYLSDYIAGKGYQIVPEEAGNRLKSDRVLEGAMDAIQNLRTVVVLEELDAYETPAITAETPELIQMAEAWNHYVGVTVTYQFGDATERLDGDTIHTWLSQGEYGNVILNEEPVAAYVKNLADQYNTAYKPKTLKTSYGPTVTISKGNYGWRINQSAEAAALSEIIRSDTGQTREPIYSQTAASHGKNDYGDTYVEINLTAQHLYFYKDGQLLVEADFVSGNEAKGWSTPSGAYPLLYKQRDATLKGEGYATPVSYWMPFNGGIGMHDANWRSSFGGTLYQTGGSHGCINLPPSAAKIIYENISAGVPVLCYHLEGTQGDSSAAAPEETTAPSVPAETTAASEASEAPAETPPETTEPPADAPEPPAESSEPPSESPVAPAETPQEELPPITPPAPSNPPENPTQQETGPAGPGGSPTKQDTGAVAGPGM